MVRTVFSRCREGYPRQLGPCLPLPPHYSLIVL